LVQPFGQTRFYLHSTFPWLAAGAQARLTLHKVDANFFGTEGFLEAGMEDGPSISFFDPLFVVNNAQYEIKTAYDFTLGGFSTDLQHVRLEPIRVTNPDTIQALRDASASI
jgi:hypothetical protein